MSNLRIPPKPSRCPACRGKLLTHVRDILAKKTQRMLPLYYCMECESFCNPSGFIPSEEYLEDAIVFHESIHERNLKFCQELFPKILTTRSQNRKIIEIGCATGTLLKYAESIGIDGIGYDLNKYTVDYGKKNFGLDLRCEEWNADTVVDPDVDWVFLISVLEHIEKPGLLIKEIATYCQKTGAYLFISVPFLDRPAWKFINDPEAKGTLFFDCDEHVMHFSRRGLKRLLQLWWAKEFIPVAGTWNGFIVKF